MKKVGVIVTVIALLACLLVSFAGCKDKEFTAPEGYVAVVQVTINPTVNLYADAQQKILAVEYVNDDAKDCYKKVEESLVGADLKAAVGLVVETAANKGFLAETQEIKINVYDIKDAALQDALFTAARDGAKDSINKNQLAASVEMSVGGIAVTTTATTTETPATTTAHPTKPSRNYTTATTTAPTQNKTTVYVPNPLTDLEKYVDYVLVYALSEDEVVRQSLTFKGSEYSVSFTTFRVDGANKQSTLTYNEVTYYEDGGKGDGGEYAVTKDAVNLDGGLLVLGMDAAGDLVVKSVGEWEGISVGDVFVKQ